jgi:hypothetical protein
VERPKITPDIIARAAKMTAEECYNISDDDEKAELAKDIAADYSHPQDGFSIGKHLDDIGWDIDTNMVNDLDCMESNVRFLHTEACKQWVKENNIQPPLPIGSIITFGRRCERGEITGVCDDHSPASYLVRMDGHNDETDGGSRRVVMFEDARLIDSLVQP